MHEQELSAAIDAAKAAGSIIRRYFGTDLKVERKSDSSPVTAADREAEACIVEVLSRQFPRYGFLGEELGERAGADGRWIVDPIDGTKNFVRGIPFFATLIGLELKGEIALGLVHEPVSGELYYAVRGQGAFGPNGRMRVSNYRRMREGTIVFGGLDAWRIAGRWDAVERLVSSSGRQRGYGDYLGHVFVVRGQVEAMVELDLKPWDMAPLQILVEEAGGRFTDLQGRATIYGGAAVTSNGLVHDEVLRLIAGE